MPPLGNLRRLDMLKRSPDSFAEIGRDYAISVKLLQTIDEELKKTLARCVGRSRRFRPRRAYGFGRSLMLPFWSTWHAAPGFAKTSPPWAAISLLVFFSCSAP